MKIGNLAITLVFLAIWAVAIAIPDPFEEPTQKAPWVAEVWGISTFTLYEMVKAETCPVEPIRVGRHLRWPTLAVLRSVGLAPEAGTTVAEEPGLRVVGQ